MSGALWAQTPVGGEFQVNTYTTGFQVEPAVASSANGNFVVVWWSLSQDGSSFGVFGQRYDVSGAAQGAEFQVNSYITGYQGNAAVTSDASGNFIVTWTSSGQDGSGTTIVGQRYDASGIAQGTEFQVNSYTTGYQLYSSVASDANGNFVVVWASLEQDGSAAGVFGQRYDVSGAAQGAEFQVNSYTIGDQIRPAVATDASGNFVVVWQSFGQDGSYFGVFGQRYDASGIAQGPEFQVNSYTTGGQDMATVASDASGNFVVVWSSVLQDGSSFGVFGQRYDASGTAQGAEFQVNSHTTSVQDLPSVASDANGNFVVAWTSYGYPPQDGSSHGVFGQRYDAAGAAQGAEFQVNSYTTGFQGGPSVASDASGNFVVVWPSDMQDGSSSGVFGQRFAATLTVAIDIKPSRFPNPINLRSRGVIPVAILTTPTFDATTVNPLSVEFGPDAATEAHGRGHVKDVDADGDEDLLLHFSTRATGIQCGAISASLSGETGNGAAIEGSDSVVTVGCGCRDEDPDIGSFRPSDREEPSGCREREDSRAPTPRRAPGYPARAAARP